MTFAADPRPNEHDWQSMSCVEEWIASSNARATDRRPMLRRLASLLPCSRDAEIHVLDVGGGHGELTVQVLEEWPKSSVVLQDFSAPMLDIARERLAEYGPRVEVHAADLSETGWSKDLGGPFDSVVSSIAIHNVGDPQVIHAIYNEIFSLVKPGGGFFNLDYVFMPGSALSDLYQRASGRPATTANHAHPQDTSGERASLLNQLLWLKDAGFDEVDCLWKELRQSMLCGLRAG